MENIEMSPNDFAFRIKIHGECEVCVDELTPQELDRIKRLGRYAVKTPHGVFPNERVDYVIQTSNLTLLYMRLDS